MKPMLAVQCKKGVPFPVYASPKLDGVRAVVKDSLLLSRSLKPIPNAYTQELFGCGALDGLDGELCVGPPHDKNVMQATTSGVMTHEGQPDVTFWVFDFWTRPDMPFHLRNRDLRYGFTDRFCERHPRVQLLPQLLMQTQESLDMFKAHCASRGYEGVMIRKADGLYKYGRSTEREGHLLKIKDFADGEAVVIGFEEKMHNGNEATIDELGYTKRSSHLANLVPMNTLGALRVRDMTTGIEFSIGTGFVDVERKHIWDLRDSYLNKIAVYKHFEIGVKVAPRFPVFKGFRDSKDMS